MAYSKKTYRKKRSYRRKKVSRPHKGLTPFPKTRMVKLRYVTNVELNAAVGAVAQHQFRANSCYDPDYTGTGGQPYYFDQLMQMYSKYTVVGSKMTVMPFGNTTTGEYSIVGIYRDTDATLRTANLVECMEAPGTKWVGLGDANQNPRRLTITYSAKKMHGANPIANEDLDGTASTNPTDSDFFTIFTGCPTSTTNPGTVTINVVIEYTVLLHDRIDPATS